jgi:hypothetical protein
MKRFKIIGPLMTLAFLFLSFYSVIANGGGNTVFLPIIISSSENPTQEPTEEPTQEPTEEPTQEPTEEPTPEPTETPPPGPTPEPETVYILPNHTHYSEENRLHIVGEVENASTYNLRNVRITANFFNSSGQFLETSFTYTYLNFLPAGEKTCFHLFLDIPVGWDTYEFELSYWADGEALPNLSLSNLSSVYNPIPDLRWYEITGEVTNDEAVSVNNVGLAGTLYNASNDVVGCSFTYIEPSDLAPGQTREFSLTFQGRDYADVTHDRLQASGDKQ